MLPILFEVYRLGLRALVLLMGAHFLLSAVEFLRQKRNAPVRPPPPDPWPRVTVQLPIRNEYYAARRVIEAAAALRYPKDRLQIQIVDDSDDATSEIAFDSAMRLRAQGLEVVHIHRDGTAGHKAGALDNALESATGELIAMFDADFAPRPDFLERTVPFFVDDSIGMVQGRWEHTNRNETWFTRLQAQILDGLMVVEQTAKSRAGVPLQFNGTGGVWRREAIDRAGGWRFDSLTEDLDLSMRAQFAGYRLVHLPDVGVPSLLPTSLGLFRVQQRRWALGTAQLLRKRLGSVLRADLPISSRIAMLFQLCRHFAHPLLLLMVITVPLTTFSFIETRVEYGLANALVIAVVAFGIAAQHVLAAHELGRSKLGALLLSPMVIPLAIALAPTYTVALLYGLRDRAGAFHRTPKVLGLPVDGAPIYRARRSVLIVVETLIGVAYVGLTGLALSKGWYLNAAFLGMVAFAFSWFGLGSLHVNAETGVSADTPLEADAVAHTDSRARASDPRTPTPTPREQ